MNWVDKQNNKVKTIIKNSTLNVISQILTVAITFATRVVSLKLVGAEVLGINGTILSLIGALSLADLGFQSAIIYRLYAPIKNHDENKINEIVNIFRVVYRFVGCAIFVLGMILIPFLPMLLKDVVVGETVYIIYVIHITNTVISYFSSYRQTLLFANQKDYITKSVFVLCRIICGGLKIVCLVYFRNYYLFLATEIIQTLAGNIIVHIISNKYYPYLHIKKYDNVLLRTILGDVKHVFSSRMASYVYFSTDNIIISSLIGAVHVTLLGNYTIVTNQIKTLVNSLMDPIIPFIGEDLVDKSSKEIGTFFSYTHLRFLVACFLIIPTFVLIDPFVSMAFGEEYVLGNTIKMLLTIDLYINILYAPCYEYNNASGLFNEEKKVMIKGAIINLITSIILAFPLALSGILLGTVVSQVYLWISRGKVTFTHCLPHAKAYESRYIIRNLIYIIIVTILCFAINYIFENTMARIEIGGLVLWAIAIEVTVILLALTVFNLFPENKKLLRRVDRKK